MTPQTRPPKHKAGYVHARLSSEEQTRVEQHAQSRGLTVSKWVRERLLEALGTSPRELRLMSFIAAQTAAIRLTLEEWQQGKDLSDAEVQARIQRHAIQLAAEFTNQTVKKLSLAQGESGD